MDIQRKDAGKKRLIRRIVIGIVLVAAVAGTSCRGGPVEAGRALGGSVRGLAGHREARSHDPRRPRPGNAGARRDHADSSHHRRQGAAHSDPSRHAGEGEFGGHDPDQPGTGNRPSERRVRHEGRRSRLRQPEGHAGEAESGHAVHGGPGGCRLQHRQAAGRPRRRAGQGRPVQRGGRQDLGGEGRATGQPAATRAEANFHQLVAPKRPSWRPPRSRWTSCAGSST